MNDDVYQMESWERQMRDMMHLRKKMKQAGNFVAVSNLTLHIQVLRGKMRRYREAALRALSSPHNPKEGGER